MTPLQERPRLMATLSHLIPNLLTLHLQFRALEICSCPFFHWQKTASNAFTLPQRTHISYVAYRTSFARRKETTHLIVGSQGGFGLFIFRHAHDSLCFCITFFLAFLHFDSSVRDLSQSNARSRLLSLPSLLSHECMCGSERTFSLSLFIGDSLLRTVKAWLKKNRMTFPLIGTIQLSNYHQLMKGRPSVSAKKLCQLWNNNNSSPLKA